MPKPYISTRHRAAIIKRAHERCEYCLTPLDFFIDPYVIDHIFPKSQGGSTELNNLALSCQGCNSYKYNKTTAVDPVTEISVPLYNPRHDSWEEHFVWSGDFTLLIGITAHGRATVNQLQLNRPGVVNLRHLLFMMGEYP